MRSVACLCLCAFLLGGAESAKEVFDGAARARVARSGLVASRGAMVCDALFFMALAFMIWQP